MQHKRLYISADMEGVAGVVTQDHLMPDGFEYQRAREWMTDEVIAACQSAFDKGIEDIVISDSHGNGQNLLLDKLPDNVQVVRSWPRPLCMMEGIQNGHYDAALLIGYHSGASDLRGVLRHTLHGRGINELRLNGQVASETVISAATAGHFDVPVMMVSGDDAYVEHAGSVLGDVEGVVTKWANSATSARTLLPRVACEYIGSGVADALNRLHDFQPLRLETPINLEIVCTQRKAAELLAYLPIVERLDAYTTQFTGKNMIEISQFLSFLLACGALTAK